MLRIVCVSDILSKIACLIDPRHLGNLRMSCTLFSASITSEIKDACVQDAVARYTRAVLLPNGAFRLSSRFGVHTADFRAVPGMRQLMVEASVMNSLHTNPVVCMKLDGAFFLGRPWAGLHGRVETLFETLFQPGSGVWISALHRNVNFFNDGTLFTVVGLAFGTDNRRLHLVFTPVGW
jgi:hypothetical protein